MKLALIACVMLATGCFWADAKSQNVTGMGARVVLGGDALPVGGNAEAQAGMAGLSATGEVRVEEVTRTGDPNTYTGIGLGVGLKLSPFGVLATDHRLERWFDLGGECGAALTAVAGVPPHNLGGTAGGWYGAWVEIGTADVGGGYLAITGTIRRESFQDPYLDQTQVLVGVAWRTRKLAGPLNFHD